jgi:hypothetical protein
MSSLFTCLHPSVIPAKAGTQLRAVPGLLKQNEIKVVMARFRRATHGVVKRGPQQRNPSVLKFRQIGCFEGIPCCHYETCILTQWVARLKRAMTDFRILPDQTNPEPL